MLYNTNIFISHCKLVRMYQLTYWVLRCKVHAYVGYIIMNILIGLWLRVTPSSWCKLFCTIDLIKQNKLFKITVLLLSYNYTIICAFLTYIIYISCDILFYELVGTLHWFCNNIFEILFYNIWFLKE